MDNFFSINTGGESEREATYQDQVSMASSDYITYEGFETPTDLVVLFNTDIRDGHATLYPWQVRLHEQFSQDTGKQINNIALVANNGSGKSQFVLAPCAVWMGMVYKQARVIITSSSGAQLDKQTCDAITLLLQEINKTLGEKVWKINYRHYTNLKTGSEIVCYATDEPGKAEGFHPKVIGGKFAILIDEAKSIPEPIFEAIGRCTGNSHRLEVSSPGGMHGTFYRHCSGMPGWRVTKVSYRDCPHVNLGQVEEDRATYGESSAYFRSKHLAEFTSEDEQVVIPIDQLEKYMRKIHELTQIGGLVWFNKGHKRAGIDIASVGKCESVFSLWDGGHHVAQEIFHIGDTTVTAKHIEYLINKYDVPAAEVNVDDGNVGKAVIDMLWRDGYMVNRVLNQSAALDKNSYGNRGAEMWFSFSMGLHMGVLHPLGEAILQKQLCSRYYRKHKQTGKTILEPKPEAIALGHGSPDRADAAILAFAKCNSWIFDKWREESGTPMPVAPQRRPGTSLTNDDILRLNEERKYRTQIPGVSQVVRKPRSQRTRDLLKLSRL